MDLLFTVSAVLFNLLIAGVFIAERLGSRRWVRIIGTLVVLLLVPFTIVFIDRLLNPTNDLALLCLSAVLVYLLVELLLDFIIKYDFRAKWATHIPYILLEYGAFFGLIYYAKMINKTVLWLVSITFWFAMICLIFMYARNKKPKEKAI